MKRSRSLSWSRSIRRSRSRSPAGSRTFNKWNPFRHKCFISMPIHLWSVVFPVPIILGLHADWTIMMLTLMTLTLNDLVGWIVGSQGRKRIRVGESDRKATARTKFKANSLRAEKRLCGELWILTDLHATSNSYKNSHRMCCVSEGLEGSHRRANTFLSKIAHDAVCDNKGPIFI